MECSDEVEVIRETRVRYVHHKSKQEVGVRENHTGRTCNSLSLMTAATDTIVMEKLENSVVISLRLLNINYRRITRAYFSAYDQVTKLEIGCPVSITWVFRTLPTFPNLKVIRFGRLAFDERDEDQTSTVNFATNPTVKVLEITYNKEEYLKLSTDDKVSIDTRISAAIQLAEATFPSLQQCDIIVPKSVEPAIDKLLQKFPEVQATGEKRLRYAEGFVHFTNKLIPVRHRKPSAPDNSNATNQQAPKRASAPTSSKAPRTQIILKRPKVEAEDGVVLLEDDYESQNGHDEFEEHQVKPLPVFHDPRLHRGRRSPSLIGSSSSAVVNGDSPGPGGENSSPSGSSVSH